MFPDYLQTIYITPNEPNEPFQRELRSRLYKHCIQILCEHHKNVTTLILNHPTVSEQVIASGPSDQVQRYKLIYSITYTLILPEVKYTRTITRSRELSRTTNQLLSNSSEQQKVLQELISESVNELLRQITAGPPHTMPCTDALPADNNPC